MNKFTPKDVEEYYNKFSHNVLLENFRTLNLRQEKIISLCQDFVPDHSIILEIGCGVGIITKTLHDKASSILATDLSSENIKIAREYLVEISHCKVQVLNALEEEFPTKKESINIILLADFIEHIPAKKRTHFFEKIEQVLAPNGLVIISIPSPEYQEFIREHHPERLQIIDETVDISDLLNETRLQLLYFRYIDVWYPNQYLHIILQKGIAYQENQSVNKIRIFEKLNHYIRNKFWHRKHHNFVNRITKKE